MNHGVGTPHRGGILTAREPECRRNRAVGPSPADPPAISVFLGDVLPRLSHFVSVLREAARSYSQEDRAEQSIAALKQLAAPTVRVRRSGAVREVRLTSLEREPSKTCCVGFT